MKKLEIAKIEQYHEWVLLVVVLIYSLITYYTLYSRYIYFEMSEPADSANYMQASWSILHGTPFTTSIHEHLISYVPYNFLGDQLMFTLTLISPFLLIVSSGQVFLVIQTLIITFSAIFLYNFAYSKLKTPWLSLLVTVCYLLNPATFLSFQYFGFRAETFFMPFLFAMFLFIQKEKYILASMSLILCILTKHNAIAISFMLGLYYLFLDRRLWRFGVFCLVLSVIYYLIGVGYVMSNLQENPVAHFKHFAQFGSTPTEALFNMVLHPGRVLSLVSRNEIIHMSKIFLPAGLLSLFNPIFWVALPQLTMNLVLTDYHSIFCGWHWALIVPFLFVGMVSTIKYILSRYQFRLYKINVVVILVSALLIVDIFFNLIKFNNSIIKKEDEFYFKKNNINTYKLIDQLSVIEPEASVMVSGQLLWFFFNRNIVYASGHIFHDEVDYIAILLPMGMVHYRNVDKYIIENVQQEVTWNKSKFDNFDVIFQDKNLIIFKHI